MFDRIAPVYDVMNHVMTAGLDRRWRRMTAESVVRPGDRVLDACCGTGDLALACVRAGAGSVVGLDFSPRMIERARRKSNAVAWVEGDALSLPFEDDAFDAATVGFGIRNVADLDGALRRAGARARCRTDELAHARDHATDRRARPLLPRVVRARRARCSAGRWRAAPRTRISPPACAAFPARTILSARDRDGRVPRCGLSHVRGRHRRPPYCSQRMTALAAIREVPGLEDVPRRARGAAAGNRPAAIPARSRRSARMRSPREGSGCGRCSSFSRRRWMGRPRSRRASQWS